MGVATSSISVTAELERLGWDFTFVGDDEIKCRCPAHDDKHASLSMNVDKGVGSCHVGSCGWKGDIVSFIAVVLKTTRKTVLADLSTRYDLAGDEKTVSTRAIEQWHGLLHDAKPLLKELYKRGVTDEDIRKRRLGCNRGRVTIPIYNAAGQVVNVRKYLPGAPGDDKMRNMRGRGRIRLYPLDQLEFHDVIVCGGEMKAIVTARMMNPKGVGAITATAGEGKWDPSFTQLFAGKRVWVCMDVDEPGVKAADRVAAQLRATVDRVFVLRLPLDTDAYPTGDLNDYFGPKVGATADDLFSLMEKCEPWAPPQRGPDPTEVPEEVGINDVTKAKHAGKRVSVTALVTAIDSNPYLIPHVVSCECSKDQPLCAVCPVYAETPDERTGLVNLELPAESPAVVAMVNASLDAQREALREGLGVPACKVVAFKARSHYNVEDLRLAPDLDIEANRVDERLLPTLAISHGIEGNTLYRFVGRTYPHPRSQRATLLASAWEPARDALGLYEPSEEELEELTVFQPTEWSLDAVRVQLDEIYNDLEANVTRIFKRRDLHLFVDLAYHSPLVYHFDRRSIKGWVEVLILGDSAQGKSETAICLQRHYGLGEKVESKNASVAGLLGGLQQLGGRWFVTWGKIPLNDRRLVILEELKGASPETISKLTDMRSSGIAELDKIEKRRTTARARLIALSNPRSNQPLSSYNFGVDAIRELIGSPEDIRRFDACLIVAATDISATELNQLTRLRPKVQHRFTSELCRRCVLWAWSRLPEEVEFTEPATEDVLKAASELCERYNETIPIIDRGSMRHKVARLAAALAARTFSCGRSRKVIVVRPCHVQFIQQLLDRVYSSPSFGYLAYSEAYRSARTLVDHDKIRSKIAALPYPQDFIGHLLHTTTVELRDLCDWCGWERGEAMELLSFLVRKHALVRDDRAYRKTSEFINLLKKLQTDELVARPDHVEEDF